MLISDLSRRDEKEKLTALELALGQYVSAIKTGELRLDTITSLLTALESVQEYEDLKNAQIQLSLDQVNTLIHSVHEYTLRLAQDNQITLKPADYILMEDSIQNFRHDLTIQKRIFELAD